MSNGSSGADMGWDGTVQTISRQFDWTETPPSAAVVRLISAALDCDPMSIEPLGSTIDPDALDRLLVSMDEEATVRFTHLALTVLLYGDGTVSIAPEET